MSGSLGNPTWNPTNSNPKPDKSWVQPSKRSQIRIDIHFPICLLTNEIPDCYSGGDDAEGLSRYGQVPATIDGDSNLAD